MDEKDKTIYIGIVLIIALIIANVYKYNTSKNNDISPLPEENRHPVLYGEAVSYGNAVAVGMDAKAESNSNSTAVVMGDRIVKKGERVDVKYVDGSFITTIVPDKHSENMANS